MGRPKKLVSLKNIQNFQRELDLAGNNAEVLLSDKKGRSRSCLLCRRRKQRCDRKQPSCTNCAKANVKCIQPARYSASSLADAVSVSPTSLPSFDESTPANIRSHAASGRTSSDQYTLYLESKVQSLEKRLNGGESQLPMSSHNNAVYDCYGSPQTGNPNDSDETRNNSNKQGNHHLANTSVGLNPSRRSKLFGPVPSFTSAVSNREGKKTGTTLPALSSDSLESIDFSNCIFSKYNLKEFYDYDPAFEFDGVLSRSFLDTFFTRLQFKYPLLDEQEIYDFHENYTTNNVHAYSETSFHFGCGRMWLVFSISACLFMTTGKYKGLPPVRYFSTAIRHITRCGQSLDNVQRVELLTLLVLYILRTDRDSSVLYDIIRDVMAICKNSLHLNVWQPNDINANKKLRIFWCVYLLERMICVAVGRPFTISEREIGLPLFSEDSFNSGQNFNQERCHNGRGVHFINQSLRLRRIESQFVEHLQILPLKHSRKETLREQLPTVKKFFHDLEVWRSSCSKDDIRNFENETLKLYYYRSVRLLIQPYLEFLTPEDRLFRECQAAAGQICQLYKIFHQKTLRGHSTPAIHTVFIAGVTLIYCMWLARNFDDEKRKRLGDDSKHTRPLISASLFSTMDDLRACSVCLYVMTERSNFARTFRDTFDELMNATVGNLIERCGPNSSELIHLSSHERTVGKSGSQAVPQGRETEGGMPPATDRTFGKRQAEEHVGFVEISQVDPEEQKEFKRKQGVLEETSVPKSLAHLLIKVGGKGNAQDQPDVSKARVDRDKYIVQKPANSAEFDWETFQQQAFVQQHMAKENLKAYLTALKYSSNNKHPADHSTSPIFAPALPEQPTIDKTVPAAVKVEENDDRGSMAPAMPSMAHMMPQVVSNTTTSSNSPNSLNAGLLFSNGTHDMINDISTWTNESVVNLMDKNQYLPIDFNSQDTLSFLPQEDEFLPQIKILESQRQQSNSSNGFPSSSHLPPPTTYMNPQDKFMISGNAGLSSIEKDQERKRPHLVPSNAGRENIAEKFWTVNDDYSFLT